MAETTAQEEYAADLITTMQKNLTMLVTLDSDGEEMDVQMTPAKPLDRALKPPEQQDVKLEPVEHPEHSDEVPPETLDGGVKDVDGSTEEETQHENLAGTAADPETHDGPVTDVEGEAAKETAEASGGPASSADAAAETETAEKDEDIHSLDVVSPGPLYNGLEKCGACGTCANCAAELGPN